METRNKAMVAGVMFLGLPNIERVAPLDAPDSKEVVRPLIANRALQIICAPREQLDANDYSEMLGYTTVRKQNITREHDVSRSESDERHVLMLPQELKAMSFDKEVFLYEGIPQPVMCEKMKSYQDNYFTTLVVQGGRGNTRYIKGIRMTALVRLLTLSLILFPLSACGKYKVPEYQYTYNDDPKQRYEITMLINDAPGNFNSISGLVDYEVLDRSCAPYSDSINKIRDRPEQEIKFNYSQVSGNEYRGIFYTDLIKDEDYFDLGICKWSFASASYALTAKNGMVFYAHVMKSELKDGFEKKFYFLNEQFLEGTSPGLPLIAASQADPSGFAEEKRNNLFSISIRIRKDN